MPLYKKVLLKHPNLKLKESMLNTLGLKLAFNPINSEPGIHVLLLALYIYPESANLYDSLAEAYLYKRDIKNAVTNFKQSLKLNPENQNAIDRLKELEE